MKACVSALSTRRPVSLVDRDGRWRQIDQRGRSLWPRTFHDDHGVTHALLLDSDWTVKPILVCTGHTAHRTGVDERNKPLTCLTCIVKTPQIRYDQEDDA